MYEPPRVPEFDKCGKVITKSKELIRIKIRKGYR